MTPTNYRIKLYTGPIAVKYYADRLRDAGYTVVCEGTEHVYFIVADEGDGWGAIGAMSTVMEQTRLTIPSNDWTIVERFASNQNGVTA